MLEPVIGAKPIEKILSEAYVPDSCLQRANLPAHLLWDKSVPVEIEIGFAPTLDLVAVYNAADSGLKSTPGSSITIRSFEVNGYLGMLFRSRLLSEARRTETIKIRIASLIDSRVEQVEKRVELFRPNLEIGHVPSEITVTYNRRMRTYSLSEHISLQNTGFGTAVLFIEVAPRGKFSRALPDGIDEFQKAFMVDLRIRFDMVSIKWPKQARLLADFLTIIGTPSGVNDKLLSKIRRVFDRLNRAIQNNESFGDDIAGAVGIAYIRNVKMITDLKQFTDYLNSIGEGRIVLWNSVEALRGSADSGILRLRVEITDLNSNRYDPVSLPPIRVLLRNTRTVPIHVLFQWKKNEKGGETSGRRRRGNRR